MAAAVQELADSLTQDEIPIKLRCASCNKLVVNAFRLPCCDQNVCESCQKDLPDTCPVCMHAPLSADDCTPNKALRLTVKAFLKNEEKKRDKLKTEAVPPVIAAPTPPPQAEIAEFAQPDELDVKTHTADDIVQSIEEDDLEPAGRPQTVGDSADSSTIETTNDNERDGSIQQDDGGASPNIAIITGDEENQHTNGQAFGAESATLDREVEQQKDSNQQQTSNARAPLNMAMNNGMNNGFGGFDPTMMQNAASGMNSMNGMNGMNAMNGMNGWGGFPNMMGMGMDPSMMMYGGFNGQNMGYNGMNMGMMGFDGGFGNWGNQMGSGMNGNFGANAGYYPNSGYNQQSHRGAHFNQMSQRNFPSNHRSGHGQRFAPNAYDRNQEFHNRAGHAQQSGHDVAMKQQQQQQQQDLQIETVNDATKDSDKRDTADDTNTPNQLAKETETAADSIEKGDDPMTEVHQVGETSMKQAQDQGMTVEQDETKPVETYNAVDTTVDFDTPNQVEPVQPQAASGFVSNDPVMYGNEDHLQYSNMQLGEPAYQPGYNVGYNEFGGRGRGAWRGRGRGRGGFRGGYGGYANTFENVVPLTTVEPAGQGVEGAPKGPKAMREGAPVPGFRGRGGFVVRGGRGGSFAVTTNGTPAPTSAPSAVSAEIARAESPAYQPDGGNDKRSRSRTRSPSRHRSHRRQRSASPTHDDHYREQDSSDEYHRSKKRRQSRKQDDDRTQKDSKYEEDARPTSRGQNSDSRHHSRKHKSSHHDKDRSRSRDRDHERSEHSSRRRRHRTRSKSPRRADDINREDDSSRPRSHRHRDRERDDDYRNGHRSKDFTDHEVDKDKDRERKSSRRDRSSDRHRSSRTKNSDDMPPPSASTAPSAPAVSAAPPPTAPKGPASKTPAVREFKIHGRSRMTAPIPPTAPRAVSNNLHASSSSTSITKSSEPESKRPRTDSKPEIDPHTLEREARNRERMLKEAQRMSVLMNRGDPAGGGRRGSESTRDKKKR